MGDDRNRRLVLRNRPRGAPSAEDFELQETEVRAPGPGEVQVRTLWLGFDPAQRGWLNDIPSYIPPVAIGEVMRAHGIGEVVASNHPGFQPGDVVDGLVGWQTWAVGRPDDPRIDLHVVPPSIGDPKLALGPLGITGLTAYFGMLEIGQPRAGDVVLVTAAAGATGSIAAQIARIKGAQHVIGTAGSEEKRAWARDIAGLDECIDHYAEKPRRAISAAAPDGLNVVFDNVGGALLDAALFNIALRARIVLCGSISTGYRPERPEVGLHHYQLLTTRRSRMEGFIVFDFADRYEAARAELAGWLRDGRLRYAEDIAEGLENAPATLARLLTGGNLGKQLLRVADPITPRRPAHDRVLEGRS